VFEVVKFHKRLWIKNVETEQLIYTPPCFINVVNRECLNKLANDLNDGVKYIDAVIDFENSARRKRIF
jgi:hypothetical protein